jgi:hypothetical protein
MAFEGEDARRWSMTDAPTLLPAVDWITRSPNGPFLDTGINLTVESKGRVYLSVDTLCEMAEIAGLLESKDNATQALHDKEQYEKGYADGLKKEGQLVESLMAITHILAGRSTGIDDLSGDKVAEKLAKAAGVKLGKPAGNSDDVQATSK